MVWMSDWVDSRYVYCYSLETGKYYTKMQCRPCPYWCQGIFIADGKMLFAADDGESTFGIADNIYVADITSVPYTGLKDGTQVSVENFKAVRGPGQAPQPPRREVPDLPVHPPGERRRVVGPPARLVGGGRVGERLVVAAQPPQ